MVSNTNSTVAFCNTNSFKPSLRGSKYDLNFKYVSCLHLNYFAYPNLRHINSLFPLSNLISGYPANIHRNVQQNPMKTFQSQLVLLTKSHLIISYSLSNFTRLIPNIQSVKLPTN